jgi:hypothetical protein
MTLSRSRLNLEIRGHSLLLAWIRSLELSAVPRSLFVDDNDKQTERQQEIKSFPHPRLVYVRSHSLRLFEEIASFQSRLSSIAPFIPFVID